jgi:hypothetical protein
MEVGRGKNHVFPNQRENPVLWHTNVVLSVTGLPDELSKLISHA